MGFEKGNQHGKKTKRGKAKKTIIKESLDRLQEIGITPLQNSKTIIDNLLAQEDLSVKDSLNLLTILTSLYKYELLTRAEEIKLDELLQENEELINENQELKQIFDSPQDLLKKLKEEK